MGFAELLSKKPPKKGLVLYLLLFVPRLFMLPDVIHHAILINIQYSRILEKKNPTRGEKRKKKLKVRMLRGRWRKQINDPPPAKKKKKPPSRILS